MYISLENARYSGEREASLLTGTGLIYRLVDTYVGDTDELRLNDFEQAEDHTHVSHAPQPYGWRAGHRLGIYVCKRVALIL